MENVPTEERADRLVALISNLREAVGIAATVGRFGVKKSDLPRLTDFALQDACMATNPKLMARCDVEAIYEAIL